jgi:hypothetical protein
MMNKRETMLMTIVGMAVLTTITTMSSPTQALALGHWNVEEDHIPSSGFAEDGMDSSGTSDNTNGEEEEDNGEDGTTAATEDDEAATEDGDEGEGSEESNDSNVEEDSSHLAYEEFQGCLSGIEEEGSPTEQEVQDCMESSYGETDSNENTSTESTDDGDEDENGMTDDVSTDDTQDQEDEDNEE